MPKRQTNHRTFVEIARLRARFREHLMAGLPPKTFAIEHGIKLDTGWIYRWATEIGWSSFYVSAEEKAQLIAQRRARATSTHQHAA